MGVTPIIIITLFLLMVAIGIIMLVLVYQKKQLEYLRDKEQLKVTFEKEILQSQLEIQEQTFKNISQEIHDNIGQVLSLVKLNITMMNLNDTEGLLDKMDASKQLLGKAIQDLRDLSKTLNSDYLKETGLVKSIEHEVEMIRKTGCYKTVLTQSGNALRLSSQHELILFRIFQEIINNIIKHSGASCIEVRIDYAEDCFQLQIKDDGRGFDIFEDDTREIDKRGLGIRNMKARAGMIGARLDIASQIGSGTTVNIDLLTAKGI